MATPPPDTPSSGSETMAASDPEPTPPSGPRPTSAPPFVHPVPSTGVHPILLQGFDRISPPAVETSPPPVVESIPLLDVETSPSTVVASTPPLDFETTAPPVVESIHPPAVEPVLLNIAPAQHIIIYHQTHFRSNGEYVSLKPLIENLVPITHLILAAIHLNEDPGNITLNDDPPDTPRNEILWKELGELQVAGFAVLGMLGGAAKGSFARLDGSQEQFEAYYTPLRDMISTRGFNGLDLDVEEEMSFDGIVRLIDRLKSDFGDAFLITLAPVATALMDKRHLSGFNYIQLEIQHGRKIAWYNTQFYCGWGSMASNAAFDYILVCGWHPSRIVIGLTTNPQNAASGHVELDVAGRVIDSLIRKHGEIGGVMGWEYFNSLPGDEAAPWEWANYMFAVLWGYLFQ
jgi:hypothetical protein